MNERDKIHGSEGEFPAPEFLIEDVVAVAYRDNNGWWVTTVSRQDYLYNEWRYCVRPPEVNLYGEGLRIHDLPAKELRLVRRP